MRNEGKVEESESQVFNQKNGPLISR